METLKPYAIKTLLNIFNTSNIPVRRTITGEPYIDNNDIIKNVSKLYEFINNHDYAITTKRDYLIILSNVFTLFILFIFFCVPLRLRFL